MKSHEFDDLCLKVRLCTRCPRMDNSARVLSRAAGPLDAPVMFVGEAPGRLGADASEIPFHGDKAGHNFEELLAFVGLDRSKIFVTNAALCNPRTPEGNNATPSREELSNCSNFLKEQIDLVQPRLVVSLGAVALSSLATVSPHNLDLSTHVRTSSLWYDRTLIPLYHPGSRAMIHRSMANQRSDYQFVAETLARLTGKPRKVAGQTKSSVAELARRLIRARGTVSYFALHKLLFLVEWHAWSSAGHALSNAFFIRQKDGPYCTDLHLAKLRKALAGLVVEGGDRPMLRLPDGGLFAANEDQSLSGDAARLVDEVLDSTRNLSDAELKTKVYMSAPMRALLRAEKTQLLNLYNSPIRFDAVPRTASGRG